MFQTRFRVSFMIMAVSMHQKDQLKSMDSKSKNIQKHKKDAKKKLKGSLEHCNPKALMNEVGKIDDANKADMKAKKRRKKKKKKGSNETGNTENNNVKKENYLEELKKRATSGSSDISSNWKNLLSSMSKQDNNDEEEKPARPAFFRRDKKGRIFTNQQINHPKAVIIGNKRSKKSEEKKTDPEEKEEDDIWFDDVDPILLDVSKSDNPEDSLVKSNSFKGVTKILGMDCEMVGVGEDGSDSILARVSIVNHFGNCLYDKFVAPREKVTDYRTQVSGVREEDLADAPNFKTVQAEVAELIKGRTLVGHAIHHDLKVLFLDHPKKMIRDTSNYKRFRTAFGGRTPGNTLNVEEHLL